MMPCANCNKVLTSLPNEDRIVGDGDDFPIMLQGIRTFESDRFEEDGQRVYDIPVSEALSTVFEAHLKLNQKHLSNNCQIRMCFLCLSSLISLNEAYTKFLKLTVEGSFIEQLLETSILWSCAAPHNDELVEDKYFLPPPSCKVVQEENFLPLELKRETIEYDVNMASLIIKEEEQDFGLDEYQVPSTSLIGTDNVLPVDTSGIARLTKLKEIQRRLKSIKKATTSTPTKSNSTKVLKHVIKNEEEVVKEKEVVNKNEEVKGRFKCTKPGCTKSFSDKRVCRYHIKFRHGDATPEELAVRTCYACPTPQVFEMPGKLRRHQLKVHDIDIPPPAREPNVCPHKCQTDKFPSKLSLQLHLKSVHGEVSTITCETCGRKFERGVNYRRHLKFKHFQGLTADDLEGRTCKLCDKVFGTKYQATKHHESVHNTEKPFQCDVEGCDKSFPTKNYLQIHLRSHNDNIYQCEICGKSLRSSAYLQQHIRVVHEGIRSAFCDVCGQVCTGKSDLIKHLRTHDKTRPKNFECHICHRRFLENKSLKKHINTHLGVRQHCTHCTDTFSDIGSLKRHLTSKHGIRPEKGPDSKESYECKQCGKVFILRDYLRQHLRSKSHGGKGHWAQRRRETEVQHGDETVNSDVDSG